jgi:hypothetical protein
MTRAEILERFTDVARREGFVGANADLPATADDVQELIIHICNVGDELIEQLETDVDGEHPVGYG